MSVYLLTYLHQRPVYQSPYCYIMPRKGLTTTNKTSIPSMIIPYHCLRQFHWSSWPAFCSSLASYHRCYQHNGQRVLTTGSDGRTVNSTCGEITVLITVDNSCGLTPKSNRRTIIGHIFNIWNQNISPGGVWRRILMRKHNQGASLCKGPFIATQLDSTQLDWPASRWLAVRCNWVSCIADRRRQLRCVGEGVYSDATQLNWTQLDVELSWVASL